jgi:hypothetical protein
MHHLDIDDEDENTVVEDEGKGVSSEERGISLLEPLIGPSPLSLEECNVPLQPPEGGPIDHAEIPPAPPALGDDTLAPSDAIDDLGDFDEWISNVTGADLDRADEEYRRRSAEPPRQSPDHAPSASGGDSSAADDWDDFEI